MTRFIAAILFSMLVCPAFAAITVDFQRQYRVAESERIFNDGKFVEAREAFLALAADSPTAEEKAKWQARAAIALGCQDGKLDEGLAEAAAIDSRPYSVYAQIALLSINKNSQQIIDSFGDEPIIEWQVEFLVPFGRRTELEDVRAETLSSRADAFIALRDGQRAEQDLVAAIPLIRDSRVKATVLEKLASVRRNLLKDPEGTFAANMEIVALGTGGAPYYRGVINAVSWLRDNGNYDEALKILSDVEGSQREPFERWDGVAWPASLLIALGDVYAAKGDVDSAIATYQRALKIKKLPERTQKQIEEAIAKVRGN